MSKENYTPSNEVEALASTTIERNRISPATIATIKKVVMAAVDNALRNPHTPSDIILIAGFNAGLNILWDEGHSPKEEDISRFVTELTREYTQHAMQNMTN